MHLLPDFPAVSQDGHVRRDDRRDRSRLCRIANLVHQRQVFAINNRVDRQISLDAARLTRRSNLLQVVYREAIGRMSAHIQRLYAEVDRICAGFQGGRQTLA